MTSLLVALLILALVVGFIGQLPILDAGVVKVIRLVAILVAVLLVLSFFGLIPGHTISWR